MRSKKQLFLLVVVVLILGLAQNSKTISRVAAPSPGPESVYIASGAGVRTTVSTTFVDLPLGHTFTTTNYRNILVQFFSSARMTVPGESIELRAVVDGVPVHPGPMSSSGTDLRSVSYSGFLSGVAPGTHTVMMQWRVTGGGAIMEKRTITTWVLGEGGSY